MTRKDKHAEATVMLRQAAALLDQAHSLLKEARTDQSVQTGGVNPKSLAWTQCVVESLVDSAEMTVCDDCGKLLAACRCVWSNEEVA